MATAGEGKGDDEEPRTYIARREVKVPCGLEIVVDKIAKYEGCSGKEEKREGDDEARREGGSGGGRAARANGRQYCGRAPVRGWLGERTHLQKESRLYVAWRGRQLDCQGNLLGIYGRASSFSLPGRS